MPGARPSVWQQRARVAEALALLALARMCIAWLPFRVWQRWTGRAMPPVSPYPLATLPKADQGESTNCSQDCAVAVQRAANRLRGSLCLPQAMALQWMLRRRNIGCAIVLGVLPGQHRGSLDDLHAWVEVDGTVLIGGDLAEKGSLAHQPVLTLIAPSCANDGTGRG